MNIKAEKYVKKSMKMNHTIKGDIVYTPDATAIDIIQHFKPEGLCLDPCMGEGAFYNNFPGEKDWCEITKGRDFMNYTGHADWIITNPPFSNFVPFFIKALEVSDNIVYLIYLDLIWTKARLNIMQEMGFGLKEIYFCDVFKFGRSTGAIHFQKGYFGPITINKLVY